MIGFFIGLFLGAAFGFMVATVIFAEDGKDE